LRLKRRMKSKVYYKTAPFNGFPFYPLPYRVVIADSAFIRSLQLNLSRLIAYAESADVKLQREVRRCVIMSFVSTDSFFFSVDSCR
jgi:hypothetical protein